MNRKEWAEHHRYSKELYILHKKLKQWKLDNDITERCVIHHRDDTPETIEYNEKYYERWVSMKMVHLSTVNMLYL